MTGDGRGRPAIGPSINIKMPAALVAALDARAEQEQTTRSELIRQACEQLVERTCSRHEDRASYQDGTDV